MPVDDRVRALVTCISVEGMSSCNPSLSAYQRCYGLSV